jgi:hypothetical protein
VSGGGNDLTDSLIMHHKQRIREGVKPTGGSARNATECVATVQQGEDQGWGKDTLPAHVLETSKKKITACAAKSVLRTVHTYPSAEVFLRSIRKWGGSFAKVFFIKCPHHR